MELKESFAIGQRNCQRLKVITRPTKAALHFMKLWKFFLWPNKFVLRTDHRALKWIHSMEQPPNLLIRWMETLSSFNFDVEFRQGTAHGNADALSRIEHVDTEGKTPEVQELTEPLRDLITSSEENIENNEQTDSDKDNKYMDALSNTVSYP